MKIGIFGGSFNPVHMGHINLINEAKNNYELDKIIVVPTLISPFKQKQKVISYIDRINMLKLVLPSFCEISDFEVKKDFFNVSYTIETIKHFKKICPNDELFLLLGNDNIRDFYKWKESESIIQNISKIIFFTRNNQIEKETLSKFNKYFKNYKEKIIFHNSNTILDVSSTEIREGNKFELLDQEVRKYIGNNFLYADSIIKSYLSADRAKHCFFAAEFAAKLAKTINYDAKIAYYAGLFHDIAKEFGEEKSREFISSFNMDGNDLSLFPNHKLHQICGSLWLENVYKCNNQEIIYAIKVHTTLDFELSTLDKIVFIADKICQGRNYEGIQKIRNLALKDFNKGFATVVKMNYDHQILKGKQLDSEQILINEKWIKIK